MEIRLRAINPSQDGEHKCGYNRGCDQMATWFLTKTGTKPTSYCTFHTLRSLAIELAKFPGRTVASVLHSFKAALTGA